MEITTNDEFKLKFKDGYQQFWLQKQIPTAYPGLWGVVEQFLIAFPSSYLVECGFNAVTNIFKKKETNYKTNHGDLRILLIKIVPRIDTLIAAY